MTETAEFPPGWTDLDWPVNFTPAARAAITERDKPDGWAVPRCVVCGLGVTGLVVHVHHILTRRRGGRGLISNGMVCHAEHQGPGCHVTRIHKQPKNAADNGWLRSQYARKPGVYRAPVNCWWRNPAENAAPDVPYWVVFDDSGGWRPAPDAGLAGE